MDVAIHTEYITLAQVLKKLDYISSGGEAKPFLQDTQVLVNGEPEQRRGRKLRPGDELKIRNQTHIIRME